MSRRTFPAHMQRSMTTISGAALRENAAGHVQSDQYYFFFVRKMKSNVRIESQRLTCGEQNVLLLWQ